LYNTVPAGSGVGVGEVCLAGEAVACGGTVADEVLAEQATSEKRSNTTRKATGMGVRLNRAGLVLESCV